ncbi:MAG: 4'-phosphopantetheinyl transferase superfamily protein [Desulfomonile tiedjei]|nr:4'-phosphopantetheinyl transferase superfamily protein [Desulfomonile tiedjei]
MSDGPEPARINVRKLTVQGRPVLWTCANTKPSPNASESKKENKSRLLSVLLRDFQGIRYGTKARPAEVPYSIDIVFDRMGKPRLLLNDALAPSISFSHCGGMTWAAMAGHESDVGIDAARAEEFRGDYPFHKVFNGHELELPLKKTKGDRAESAALVWSAKEAYVKAIGCAFHLFSPLEVTATPLIVERDHSLLRLRLSDRSQERIALYGGCQMDVISFRFEKLWASIAAMDRNARC